MSSTRALIVVQELLLSFLFAFFQKGLFCSLKSCLPRIKTLILSCSHWLRLFLLLGGTTFLSSWLLNGNMSLQLLIKFFTLLAEHLGKALASVRIFSFAEGSPRKLVVKGTDHLNIRLSDLINDFFLLLEESVGINLSLWLWLSCLNWLLRRWVLLLFFPLSFEFSKLSKLLVFFTLLFRINSSLDLHRLRTYSLWCLNLRHILRRS